MIPGIIAHSIFGGVSDNLILWSEAFDNAAWSGVGASVTANTDTAPDATTTADTALDDSNIQFESVRQESTSYTSTTTYTASIFIKKNAIGRVSRYPQVELIFSGTTDAAPFAETNTIGLDTNTGDTNPNLTDPSGSSGVVDYDANWWRLWVTAAVQNTDADTMRIDFFPARGAGTNWNQTATTVGSQIIWGAQINTGSLKDYVKTESTPV